jgi:hypothetical protein
MHVLAYQSALINPHTDACREITDKLTAIDHGALEARQIIAG